MDMRESYDPNANQVGAACPLIKEDTPTFLSIIVENMVVVPDVMGPYRDKVTGMAYRIDVKPW